MQRIGLVLHPRRDCSAAVGQVAGRLVRIAGSQAAARSRATLSLLDLPVLPQELLELVRPPCAVDSVTGGPNPAERQLERCAR